MISTSTFFYAHEETNATFRSLTMLVIQCLEYGQTNSSDVWIPSAAKSTAFLGLAWPVDTFPLANKSNPITSHLYFNPHVYFSLFRRCLLLPPL